MLEQKNGKFVKKYDILIINLDFQEQSLNLIYL